MGPMERTRSEELETGDCGREGDPGGWLELLETLREGGGERSAQAPVRRTTVVAGGLDYEVCLHTEGRAERTRFEWELEAAGVPIPIAHRLRRTEALDVPTWYLAARDPSGRAVAGFALRVSRVRTMPGQKVLRAKRVGAAASEDALAAALGGLADLVAREPGILRLDLAVYEPDAERRSRIAAHIGRLGFREARWPLYYGRTPILDLRRAEDEILAAFGGTARRHIRAIARHSLDVVTVADPALAPAIEALEDETRRRTGGEPARRPWTTRIAFAAAHPHLVRIAGLRSRRDGSLVAFACAHSQGDHATYAAAGSTRTAGVRAPLGYALAWDLMRWARSRGLGWFDFGGITDGTFGDGRDALGGVSDFKRRFGGEIRQVSDEWFLEPHRFRAAMSRGLSAGAALFRRLGSGRPGREGRG